jgi:hypothetical protein
MRLNESLSCVASLRWLPLFSHPPSLTVFIRSKIDFNDVSCDVMSTVDFRVRGEVARARQDFFQLVTSVTSFLSFGLLYIYFKYASSYIVYIWSFYPVFVVVHGV